MASQPESTGSSETCLPADPFDFSTRLGLTFITEASVLSAISVLALLLYIIYSAATIKRGAARHWSTTTHVHWYFLSLLVSELVQAVGGIINVRWIKDATVSDGPMCTAQGALKQMGDVGVALASLAIAMHTFCVIVMQWKPNPKPIIAITVISGIWLFVILIVSIGYGIHRGQNYYGDTQYWCWITDKFPAQRIALEYLWMWTAAFLNIMLYIPIALVLRGVLAVSGGRLRMLNHRTSRKHLSEMLNFHVAANRIAVKMLFYPAVYTCTVLPIAIVRWRAFTGHCVPWAATVVADVLFASSGLMNVLLFMFTRPNLMPQRDGSTSLPRVDTNLNTTLSSPLSLFPTGSAYPTQSRRSEVPKFTALSLNLSHHKDTSSPPASSITFESTEMEPQVCCIPPTPERRGSGLSL